MREIFKYVKANQFIPKYTKLKYNSWMRRKIIGRDNAGKPLDFSPEEEQELKRGLVRFILDILNK